MRKIRLLALDLDGTLTKSDKTVSEGNKEALRLAQEKGVTIVLASGRPVLGVAHVADELGLDKTGGYVIACTGARIIDWKTKEEIVKEVFPGKYVPEIIEAGKRTGISILSYNDIGVISENTEDRYVQLEGYNNGIPVIRVEDLEAEIREDPVNMMAVGEPEKLLEAFETVFSPELGDKLMVFRSEPCFVEILAQGCGKDTALAKLCGMLGIQPEEVMACGDGLNDIPMLSFAGIGVAMENGREEAKAAADYIAPGNDDDGVAEAIRKFILDV